MTVSRSAVGRPLPLCARFARVARTSGWTARESDRNGPLPGLVRWMLAAGALGPELAAVADVSGPLIDRWGYCTASEAPPIELLLPSLLLTAAAGAVAALTASRPGKQETTLAALRVTAGITPRVLAAVLSQETLTALDPQLGSLPRRCADTELAGRAAPTTLYTAPPLLSACAAGSSRAMRHQRPHHWGLFAVGGECGLLRSVFMPRALQLLGSKDAAARGCNTSPPRPLCVESDDRREACVRIRVDREGP